jgi:hypothetical protein
MRYTGRDIQNRVYELAKAIFQVDFSQHLKEKGKELFGIRLIEDESRRVLDCAILFGGIVPTLPSAIKLRGLSSVLAAYRVDAHKELRLPNFKADLLILSEKLLDADEKILMAQLTHELCHMIIDSNISSGLHIDCDAWSEGEKIRAFTQYAKNRSYEDDCYHTDEWFALLYVACDKLADVYKGLYASHQDATESALVYDRFDEPMQNVQWKNIGPYNLALAADPKKPRC